MVHQLSSIRRIAAVAGTAALLAALAIGGATTSQASTSLCQGGYGSNFAYGKCSTAGGTSFRVGVKCVMPGNVYYWKWTGWHPTGSVTRYIYCNPGHTARGWNYEVLLW